jgi:hypothetical protein
LSWFKRLFAKPEKARPKRSVRAPRDLKAAQAKIDAERKAFEASLAEGAAFIPSQAEKDGQRDPADLVDTSKAWVAYQDDMAASDWPDLATVLGQLERDETKQIYLGRAKEHHLTLELSDSYGVVTLMSGSEYPHDHVYLYAHTPDNLTAQVPEEQHITVGCPCCGVGMAWHASRAHMPADVARRVFLSAVRHDYRQAEWLLYDLPSYVSPGRG